MLFQLSPHCKWQKWPSDCILCCIIYHFITEKHTTLQRCGGCLAACRLRSQFLHGDLAPPPPPPAPLSARCIDLSFQISYLDFTITAASEYPAPWVAESSFQNVYHHIANYNFSGAHSRRKAKQISLDFTICRHGEKPRYRSNKWRQRFSAVGWFIFSKYSTSEQQRTCWARSSKLIHQMMASRKTSKRSARSTSQRSCMVSRAGKRR